MEEHGGEWRSQGRQKEHEKTRGIQFWLKAGPGMPRKAGLRNPLAHGWLESSSPRLGMAGGDPMVQSWGNLGAK